MTEVLNWPTAIVIIGVAFAIAWAIIRINE